MARNLSDISDCKKYIEELEEKLKRRDLDLKETQSLARELSLSAVLHIRSVEEECAELYAVIEEMEENVNSPKRDHLKRIEALELELRISKEREEEAVNANIKIAESAQEHVNELLKKIALYESVLVIDSSSGRVSMRPSQSMDRETFEAGEFRKSVVGVSFYKPVSVLKAGYLMKKSPALFKGWQSRYFVLTDDVRLTWYSKETDFKSHKSERGYLFLKDIPKATIDQNVMCENEILKVVVNNKIYEMHCGKSEVAKEWWQAIIQQCSR